VFSTPDVKILRRGKCLPPRSANDDSGGGFTRYYSHGCRSAAQPARSSTLVTSRPGTPRHRNSAGPTKATPELSTLLPVVDEPRTERLSVHQIAECLNAEGHTTRRGMPSNQVQVKRALDRAGALPNDV
jgi:hypothetical protein